MGDLSQTRADDARWMGAALAIGERGTGRTAPNPSVGCVIVRDGRVVGRGWTQPGGRPHAEAAALAEAGEWARGATAYVTLEPCTARTNSRGPACADGLIDAGIARVVAAIQDPYPDVDGRGFAALSNAGVELMIGVCAEEAERSMAGFVMRQRSARPFVTLKLATSLDGRIARADGSSRWITGAAARAHAHLERARSDAILIGRGTFEADRPRLDVRLPGLEDRAPRGVLLSRGPDVEGFTRIDAPSAIGDLEGVDRLLIEGGAGAASAFLAADLVDRLMLYRAPILIGDGLAALGDIGLISLQDAHGRWVLEDDRNFDVDRLEIYRRAR